MNCPDEFVLSKRWSIFADFFRQSILSLKKNQENPAEMRGKALLNDVRYKVTQTAKFSTNHYTMCLSQEISNEKDFRQLWTLYVKVQFINTA